MDVAASLLYDGYSYIDQTVSELSAIGSPTRSFWIAAGVVNNALLVAFAAGIWRSAGRKQALRIVAGLLVAYAVINQCLGPFSSMHQREVLAAGGATLSDTLHLAVTCVNIFLFVLMTGFAASALGNGFRLYSLATVLAMLAFGAMTSLYAPAVQANEPTPWAGIYERVCAYGSMLWAAVLALVLWRRDDPSTITQTAAMESTEPGLNSGLGGPLS
jgi:hypothetical protein